MERLNCCNAVRYMSVVLGEGVGLQVEESPSKDRIWLRGRDFLAEGGRRS